MTELQWNVEGRRFRSQEEYMAALRDKELIDSITADLELDNPQDIEKLYLELKRGKYEFESIVGRRFDDNVYELYQQIKEDERQQQEQKRLQKEKRRQRIENLKQPFQIFAGQKKHTAATAISLEKLDKDMKQEVLTELRRREKKETNACDMHFGMRDMLCLFYSVLSGNGKKQRGICRAGSA